MSNYERIFEGLKNYSYLAEKEFDDGTILIGKAPHIAPAAWLHSIFGPLNEEQIENLENVNKIEIPFQYKFFLKKANGLRMFNVLSLYGFRANYNRGVEETLKQPFNLVTPNTLERPKEAGKEIFYIGGYSCGNGASLYIDCNSKKIHVCERWKIGSLFEWKSLEEMLESEFNRLRLLFDSEGKKLNSAKNLLPFDA